MKVGDRVRFIGFSRAEVNTGTVTELAVEPHLVFVTWDDDEYKDAELHAIESLELISEQRPS